MYAIIEDSGTQFKVSAGDTIYVDLRDLTEGQDRIEFDRVLMLGEGEASRVGTPYVEGAKVVGRLGGEAKADKIDVIKFKRRKGYHRKQGHRQRYLTVTVEEIVSGKRND